MPAVNIFEVARVAVSATAALPPGESSLLRLSALDAPWLLVPLIQRVLIYDGQLPPFASLVSSLRDSLAATLARFPPLAGKIVFLPSTGDAAIDCSGSELDGGVRFLVAEMDEADAEKLSGDADHDVDTFQHLLPELETSALPAEVLALQITRLRGGLAIGVALHHAVVDGRALWMFLEAWAAACRGDTVAVVPSFDRAAVVLPGGEELKRSTLRKYVPNLPQVAPFPASPIVLPRRTFTVAEERIGHLKQRIAQLIRPTHQSSGEAARPPSSFVAVAALAWVSYVRSKHPAAISADQDVYLYFFFDIRGRRGIAPPVSESYFGTCVTGCLAKATAGDLLAEDGIATAAAAVQGEVRRAQEDPLANWDWIALAASTLTRDSALVSISGSTRFPAYEVADFGWGALGRTELVTMNSGGQVVLVAAKGGGGVQASVCMHPDHMEAFDSNFTNSFD